MSTPPLPIILPANNFPHHYAGGARIAEFRRLPGQAPEKCPEDWVASTTTRFGEQHTGLSRLPDGRLLRDAIAGDPQTWLGPEHFDRHGDDTTLLVKLLDVQNRLIIHTHPDREFADHHLGCVHGKTEAWVILETTSANPVTYLGFREEVEAEQLRRWVDGQEIETMLAALNEVPVAVGDVILVPAGLPHAIGGGLLVAEVQEPTDFSIALEWKGHAIDGPTEGHLGLGFELALRSVDRSAWPAERVAQLHGPRDDGGVRQEILPPAAAPFFRIEQVRGGADLDASFAVLIVTAGTGVLSYSEGEVAVEQGDTLVVPWASGAGTLSGEVTVLRFLPPRPDAFAK